MNQAGYGRHVHVCPPCPTVSNPLAPPLTTPCLATRLPLMPLCAALRCLKLYLERLGGEAALLDEPQVGAGSPCPTPLPPPSPGPLATPPCTHLCSPRPLVPGWAQAAGAAAGGPGASVFRLLLTTLAEQEFLNYRPSGAGAVFLACFALSI